MFKHLKVLLSLTNLITKNQPKCTEARLCAVPQSPRRCLKVERLSVCGCHAIALLLCPHHTRELSKGGIQRWVHRRQISSAVPVFSRFHRIRTDHHLRWPRKKRLQRNSQNKFVLITEQTNRIRSMKRGRQAWRQWTSLEQTHLKCPAISEQKAMGN